MSLSKQNPHNDNGPPSKLRKKGNNQNICYNREKMPSVV